MQQFRPVSAEEFHEDFLLLILGNAYARILDVEDDIVLLLFKCDGNFSGGRRVVNGIRKKCIEYSLQEKRINMGHHLSIIAEDHKKVFALLRKRRKRLHHLPQDNAHIHLHRSRDESSARCLKDLDEAVEDTDRIAAAGPG